ncbi:MAG: GGDEF domain-containing protein [Blautia sp.]|jgi:diguanylate cyclase (GGDEF)-like protein
MKKEEVYLLTSQLKFIFDIVRLVDVSRTQQCYISSDLEIVREPYQCYAVWNKNKRCQNCISAKTFTNKGQLTKYEFIDDDIYFVIAKYIEIEEEPFSLEMVMKTTNETMLDAYGKNEFIRSITNLNQKLYLDPLTNAYNRRYYEEQLSGLIQTMDAFAMMDVDDFKKINDQYGHPAGDAALKAIAELLFSMSGADDTVIRYGGDEFFVVFPSITEVDFYKRLEKIREEITNLIFSMAPKLHLSVSIGGVYNLKNSQDVISTADQALYQAKEKKNHVKTVYL